MAGEKVFRCSICRGEFTDAAAKAGDGCPRCGSTIQPQHLGYDVTLRLNWADLAMLADLAASKAAELAKDGGPYRDMPQRLVPVLNVIREKRPFGAPALTHSERKAEAAERAKGKAPKPRIIVPEVRVKT